MVSNRVPRIRATGLPEAAVLVVRGDEDDRWRGLEAGEHLGERAAPGLAAGQAGGIFLAGRSDAAATVLDQLPNLRLLVTTGMQNASIDVDAARARGVTVCGTGETESICTSARYGAEIQNWMLPGGSLWKCIVIVAVAPRRTTRSYST